MYYTQNPELDAAMHEDEQDRKARHIEAQQIAAYDIVLKELKAVTAAQWFDQKISGKHEPTADSLLVYAIECVNDVRAAFAKLMTSEQATELHEAMARFHANNDYQEILQPLPPEVVRKIQGGGFWQADGI